MKPSFKHHFRLLFLLTISFIAISSNENATAQNPVKFIGSWQGMTYGSGAYDPMFTINIKPKGVWTDLTFGETRSINAKYTFDTKKQELTLFTAKGSKLYTFKIEPATATQKERLVEQTPAKEYYRAMVCYRYKKR
ncbi:MAG TPA: hypothetical protein VF622_10765 [Segetibacter sp.]|jgi:hypothetical protein